MEYLAKDIVKFLKDHGFYEIRVKGDHHRFTDGNGNNITVPFSRLKDSVRIGTYRSILKQAKLDDRKYKD